MTENLTLSPLTPASSDEDVLTYLFRKSDEVEAKAPGLAASLRVAGERLRRAMIIARLLPTPPAETPEAEAVPPKPAAKRRRAAK